MRRTQYIPEAQRNTEAIKLRLAPEVAARLRGLAHVWGLGLAETVEELLLRVLGEKGQV
jgi:hypothetical protein